MSSACALSCPYGLSCTAPGQCPRYLDSGGDGICDLGQPMTSSAESTAYTDDDGSSSALSTSPDTSNIESANTSPDSNASVVAEHGNGVDNGSLPDEPQYFTIPVSMLLIGLYLITHFLFSKGILSRHKHRRIWNLLITAGMAGSGITGILLVLFINLSIKTALNPSLTFWHVELSILMVIGTLIHLHLYWKPFKNMFRVLFGVKNLSGFKKPAFILAAMLLTSVGLVSGLYLSSSMDGDNSSVTTLNSTENNTNNPYQYTPNSSVQSTSSDIQTDDIPGDLEEITTTISSGGGKGKKRS